MQDAVLHHVISVKDNLHPLQAELIISDRSVLVITSAGTNIGSSGCTSNLCYIFKVYLEHF